LDEDDKAQSKRFIKAAKELGVDEGEQASEQAFVSFVSRKPSRRKREAK
jgi:hypothetical protein